MVAAATLPKQADLPRLTQAELDRIAEEINARPRRVPGWDTKSRPTPRLPRRLTPATGSAIGRAGAGGQGPKERMGATTILR